MLFLNTSKCSENKIILQEIFDRERQVVSETSEFRCRLKLYLKSANKRQSKIK